MEEGIRRRALLTTLLPASLAAAATRTDKRAVGGPAQLGEFVRALDPITETPVVRLTTPAYTNLLPSSTNRFIASKSRLLVFSSDRYGHLSPHQADLRTGLIRPIVESKNLDPTSLMLDGPGRNVFYLDDGSLMQAEVTNSPGKNRFATIAEGVSAFCLGGSSSEFFLIKNKRLFRIASGREALLAENALGPCELKPGGGGCIFWRPSSDGRELWYAAVEPSAGKPVRLASGAISSPCWSSSGQSVFLLRDVLKNEVRISELREVQPGGSEERIVASTSQFAVFGPNGDDTVFVGASRSRAQPNVILLLRSTQRELTLCEHHASQPASVKPAFSPNSQRVYFQSDREGKPAIYSVNVEQLVEPT